MIFPSRSSLNSGLLITRLLVYSSLAICIGSMSACRNNTPPPADFKGPWRPVNGFDEKPVAKPLIHIPMYTVSAVDGSLKSLLERWAKQAQLNIVYRHGSDFSLTKKTSEIEQADLEVALLQLMRIYAQQNVSIRLIDNTIVVDQLLVDVTQNNWIVN